MNQDTPSLMYINLTWCVKIQIQGFQILSYKKLWDYQLEKLETTKFKL